LLSHKTQRSFQYGITSVSYSFSPQLSLLSTLESNLTRVYHVQVSFSKVLLMHKDEKRELRACFVVFENNKFFVAMRHYDGV